MTTDDINSLYGVLRGRSLDRYRSRFTQPKNFGDLSLAVYALTLDTLNCQQVLFIQFLQIHEIILERRKM